LIAKLEEICSKVKQSEETVHQAIDFMDRYALSCPDKFKTPAQMALLVCGSIMLGSKNDEMDDNIPIVKRV
jgi:hypothetical protein